MIGQRLRAAASTITLLIVLAGVPWFLYALGGGLPTSLPSAHQVHRFLGQPISDTAMIRGVSLICWAAWALFAAAVASEAAAWLTGRPSPSRSHRGARIPGLQQAAATLFLTAVLLFPQRGAHPTLPAAVPGQLVHLPTATAVLVDKNGPRAADTRDGNSMLADASVNQTGLSPAGVPPDWVSYTVKRYDTLWAIAETHLGDPLRWPQIKDATGHAFATGTDNWVDVAGHLVDEAGSRLIFPGQQIWLPADATSVTPAEHDPTAPAPSNAAPTTTQPAPPDNPPLSPPSSVPSVEPAAPTLSQRSQGPTNGVPSLAPTVNHPAAADRRSAQQEHQTGKADRIEGVLEVSSAILASGIAAAAALSTIGRLRRRQSRVTPAGRRVRLPDPEYAPTEMSLRLAARHDATNAVHEAVCALAADLAAARLPAPVVCGVLAGEDGVEMLLDRPATPPPGWTITGEGFRWHTNPSDLAARKWDGPEPLPLLVPLGRVPATTTEVLLNLEAGGYFAVTGGLDAAAGLVHSAAVSLAGLPWAKAADIILVGFGDNLAAAEPHIRYAPTLDHITAELQPLAEEATPPDSAADGVGATADREGVLPLAILSSRELDTGHRTRLQALTQTARVSVLVPDNSAQSPWVIHAGQGPVLLPQLRITVDPPCPPAEQRAALDAIIAVGLDTDGSDAHDPPYDSLSPPDERHNKPDHPLGSATTFQEEATATPTPERPNDPPAAPVVVSVLGAVEFVGAGEFRRPRAKEIALYLAMHPEGVSERRLDEIIWPTHTNVPASTRDPTVSAARAALGGADRLPRVQSQGPDKRYALSHQVSTDWARFVDLHHAGRRAGDPETLCHALGMVRGRPFGQLDAGPGYEWLHVEGHIHQMEAEIADAADLAARILLDAGKPAEARWAAQQGLLGAPYSERLWVHLMAAADALGEAQEVDRLLSEMDRTLGLDGDFESLHPDTVAAYRRYSRRTRARVP